MNDLEWPWVAISWQNAFSASTSWIRAFECQKITQPLRFCGVLCIAYQLASLGRHAQLTRCFSAVAELLVWTTRYILWSYSPHCCGVWWYCRVRRGRAREATTSRTVWARKTIQQTRASSGQRIRSSHRQIRTGSATDHRRGIQIIECQYNRPISRIS